MFSQQMLYTNLSCDVDNRDNMPMKLLRPLRQLIKHFIT
jgi:hypothetical protein